MEFLSSLCCTRRAQDVIPIRPTIPTAELHQLSSRKFNKWINGLIERAVGERNSRWSEFMNQPRQRFKSQADKIRQGSR